jgi:heterodisulfide reductase subunit A
VEVGSIIVATGFDTYRPESGEFGYGIDGVLTLPEFKRLVDTATGPLTWAGRTVRSIAYVYCVGSRTDPGGTGVGTGQAGCSQYCCTAAAHASLRAGARDAGVRQYHLYRDIRTYGKHERLYSSSRRAGSMYLRFPDDDPPAISLDPNSGPETGRLTVAVRDLLADGEQIALSVDLVVLVTGMVPRQNPDLVRALKLPVGADGFLHEIHPKLRPVETVLDGVYLAGCCQGPKTAAESVTSALAAVAQTAAILKRGTAELDPMVAVVRPGACVGCDDCLQSCPYGAITTVSVDGREAAVIDPTGCKGCGGCVPICPHDAIDLLGYTDAQMIAMIDGLLTEPAPTGEPAPAGHLEPSTEAAR